MEGVAEKETKLEVDVVGLKVQVRVFPATKKKVKNFLKKNKTKKTQR